MIDFTIPEEIEKLKEKTQKFILENVIPREKDPRQDSHGPHDTLRKELNKLTNSLLLIHITKLKNKRRRSLLLFNQNHLV